VSIIDELMGLPPADRLSVCLEVYDAASKMRDHEHRANALEMLFVVMVFTVKDQLTCESPVVQRRNAQAQKAQKAQFRRKSPKKGCAKGAQGEFRPLRLTHQPFADALKKENKS
jgi:hypothetical protein